MLEDGLSYPTRGEWTGRLIIGSMLMLFASVLVFPLLFVYGYSVRAIRTSVTGERRPPSWERWAKLLVDGLKSLFITFVYALVPNAVAGVFLFLMIVVLAGGEGNTETAGMLAGLGLLGFLVVLLVNLVVVYLLPAALTTFAAEDSARAAFGIGTVAGFAVQPAYLLALVHGTFALLFAAVLASTVILTPFAVFWLIVSLARLFGTAYRETMVDGATTRQDPSTVDPHSPPGGTQDAPAPTGTVGANENRNRPPTPSGGESTAGDPRQTDDSGPEDGGPRTRRSDRED